MGFDLDGWTVRVLEDGLPPLPERVEPSETVPVAVWRGERHGGESGMTGIRAIRGAASKRVSAIELQQGGRTSTVAIDSPCGAFVVGIESPGPATLRAVIPAAARAAMNVPEYRL